MSDLRRAAEQALEKYGESLMRVAYTYTKNMQDAQDMVQDAFLRYMSSAPQFSSDEHEKAWLIRVTINICKNHLSSAYRRNYAELDENMSVCDTYSSGLAEIVNSLPEKYRIVIHLFYYEDYTQKQIAKALGITESAVSTRLQRGRKLLKEKIGDDYFD
ncbi:MAG: sigma-70 family RNA polymerase sigma factor [Ruminococcus sp.]|nr:sigma-70 family RNA polymerase sigma factor [Ruminococcus sp.]